MSLSVRLSSASSTALSLLFPLALALALAATARARPSPGPGPGPPPPAPSPPSIWSFRIDNDPAPSPQDGPPQSVDAVRDPRLLGPEIGAILGSYLLVVVLVGIAILTVGRRLRRATQASPNSLGMEIVSQSQTKPSTANPWGPSPISPQKSQHWPSPKPLGGWGSLRSNNGNGHGKHSYQHSVQSSILTFHESVVEEDRARNEIEMDRLYAAVAEHDAERAQAKSKAASVTTLEVPQSPKSPIFPQSPLSPTMPRSPLSPTVPQSPRSPVARNPPDFHQQQQQQHLRYGPASPLRSHHHHQFPLSPPPEAADHAPSSPPQFGGVSPRRLNKPAPINTAVPGTLPSRGSSRSSSLASLASLGKRRGVSVRGLPISPPLPMSPPMGSPDFAPDNLEKYDDREPLTPREPPTPRQLQLPPTPGLRSPSVRNEAIAVPQPGDRDRRFHFAPSIRSSRSSTASFASPLTTPRTATFPIALPLPPAIAEEESRSNSAAAADTSIGGFNFSLEAAPRTGSSGGSGSNSGSGTPNNTTTTRSGRNKPAPLALSTTSGGTTTTTSLPLRTAPLPLRDLRSPMSSQRPPSTIRATELLRPERRGGGVSGFLRGLHTPGTAVPATPYSPYMPMTPLTPMTPSRLVTRDERRRAKREEGRRVLTADDMVKEEDDMWGDGY